MQNICFLKNKFCTNHCNTQMYNVRKLVILRYFYNINYRNCKIFVRLIVFIIFFLFFLGFLRKKNKLFFSYIKKGIFNIYG